MMDGQQKPTRDELATELAQLVLGLKVDRPATARYARWGDGIHHKVRARLLSKADWDRMKEIAGLLVKEASDVAF